MNAAIPEKPDSYELVGGPGVIGKALLQQHWTSILPWDEQAQPVPLRAANSASIDLGLGSEFFVTSGKRTARLTESDPFVTIPHGEFAVLTTAEVVHIPRNTLGLITMKFAFKQKGLINVSGFHVDPGFYGKIIYSVYNAGPTDISIRRGEAIFTIFLTTITGEAEPYSGKHQGQFHLSSELISSLAGAPATIVDLHRKIEALENRLTVAGALAFGVLIPLLLFLASRAI